MSCIDRFLGAIPLPFVLSVAAGGVDTIGFLALDGLFTAHVTGNIVTLAARFVAGEAAPISRLLAVPLFMLVLALTRLLTAWLERARIPALPCLLLAELLLLSGFLAVGVVVGGPLNPNAASAVCAGMLGVAAMAVQNALVRISLPGSPSTAVMTTNVTIFSTHLVEILLISDTKRAAIAHERVRNTGTAILGFVIGCAVGAASEHALGLQSLAIPIGFVFLALIQAFAAALPPQEKEILP